MGLVQGRSGLDIPNVEAREISMVDGHSTLTRGNFPQGTSGNSRRYFQTISGSCCQYRLRSFSSLIWFFVVN